MKFFRRRKFIIRKKLQYSLLALTFIHASLLIAVLAASLFVPLMIEMGEDHDPSSEAIKASHIVLFLHENFWPPVLFALLAIGLHSIRISHKIAGPLYRINIFFKDVIKGIFPKPIKLRNDDFLSEEVAVVNEAMEGFRAHVIEIKDVQEQLSNIISKSSEKLDDTSKNEISAYLKDISTKVDDMGDKIESIKVID